MQHQIKYNQIIKDVAKEVNLPEEVVNEAYKSFWLFVKTKIEELPVKKDISNDEFDKLSTSFNLPSLGKLACTRDKFEKLKKRLKFGEQIKDAKDT